MGVNYFEKCNACKPPVRYPGCQDHCRHYKEAKEKRDADMAKHKASLQMKYYINEHSVATKDGIAKYIRRRPRKNRIG